MWTNVRVKNFQSLKDVNLDLGKLTVVLGPSSSGKSGLIRALKVLVSNARGSSFITRGETTTSISLETSDFAVSLQRTGSSGTYTLTNGKDEAVFTKLGGSTPTVITERLRVPPVDSTGSLHFAEQFDRPFLLDESGSTVARILGELTNVNIIFEAVREANRRRLNVARDLNTRKEDLQSLTNQLKTFQTLPLRMTLCKESEESLSTVESLSADLKTLKMLINDIELASSELVKAEVPEVPDISEVEKAFDKLNEFKVLVREWMVDQDEVTNTERSVESYKKQLADLIKEMQSILTEAGYCPTCQRVFATSDVPGGDTLTLKV